MTADEKILQDAYDRANAVANWALDMLCEIRREQDIEREMIRDGFDLTTMETYFGTEKKDFKRIKKEVSAE